MYKRLYTFVSNNDIIYNLQFGFRKQYSTFHALININENIRKALDDGNIGRCRLKNAFGTVNKIEPLWDSWSFQMVGLNLICLIAISICL